LVGVPNSRVKVERPLPVRAPHDLLDKFLSDREIKSVSYLGDDLLLGDKTIAEVRRKARDPIVARNGVVTARGVAGNLGYECAQAGECGGSFADPLYSLRMFGGII
jgi:hypothetical protein